MGVSHSGIMEPRMGGGGQAWVWVETVPPGDESTGLSTSRPVSHTWVLERKLKYWLGGRLEPFAGINFTEKDIPRSAIMYPEQHI